MIFFIALGFIACVLLGVYFLAQSERQRNASGLPAGRVVYTDTRAWQRVEQPLISRRFGLVGKPDYLVSTSRNNAPIPVEVKSGQPPENPHAGHIFQLAAYCLLVEENFNQAPTFGFLHYAGNQSNPASTLRIDFTPALRAELIEILEEMQEKRRARDVQRSHDEFARCRGCGVAHACSQKL